MNKVKEILKAAGFDTESVDSLLEKWEFFIGECEAGYIWDYSEYRNELRVRSLIQILIDDQDIANSNSLKYFLNAVNILDQRFKKLLRSDVTADDGDNWWDRSVLKFAGTEYCEYMRKAYEIKVTCME